MDTTSVDFPVVIEKFDKILARGLCAGVGERDGQMCIEAAICAALDLPHGDDPLCVASGVRTFKIALNDSDWSSPEARAKGLRDLGIAQIGSKGVVKDEDFTRLMQQYTIQRLIPDLFRRSPFTTEPYRTSILKAADDCERLGTPESAARAARAARAAGAAAGAAEAAWAAEAAGAAWAAEAARAAGAARAARAAALAAPSDHFLLFSASIALDVLRELKSPGVAWLDV